MSDERKTDGNGGASGNTPDSNASTETRKDCHNPTASPETATDNDRECAKQKAEEQASKMGKMPPIDFSTLAFSLATQALVHMGQARLPGQPEGEVNLPMAKQTIDIITMLETKTKGNLNETEARLMQNLLYDLRTRYVQVAKRTQKD